MFKKITLASLALAICLVIGSPKAHAVMHIVSGLLAMLGSTEEESSVTPDYIESLFVEIQKLKFIGEAAQDLESKLGPLNEMLAGVNETIGSANFSPLDIVGESSDALNSPNPTTIENPAAMFGWLNDNLIPDEAASHEELTENAKELAILRNGARTTQYSQAMRMFLDMDARSEGLHKYSSYSGSGDASTYQAFLSSYEARVYELNTDRLYMQTLSSISADSDFMAANSEVFKK